MMKKRWMPLVGRVFAGVSLVGLVLWQADLSQMSLRWDGRASAGTAAAVGLMMVALLFSAVRWRLVLGDAAPSLHRLWKLYLVGWFFSLFLPSSVGGDAVRAVAVTRGGTRAGEAMSSIVVERLLGVAALMTYLLLGCVLAPAILFDAVGSARLNYSVGQLLAVAGVGIALLWLAVHVARRIPRVAALTEDALEVWRRFRRSPARLGSALLVSLMVQAVYILVWFTLAWSLRLEVPALAFLVFVPFVSLAAMLPVTLSGLGVREGAWALLLAPFGVPAANAVAFSLLYYAGSLAVGLIGGALFTLSGMGATSVESPDAPGVSATPPVPAKV